MDVILREDVTGLGMIGDVVAVKPGYARNYLLPRGMAVIADRRNLKQLEHDKRVIEAKKLRERGTVERVADAMKGLTLEVEKRAGKGGKLFGSVTNMDLSKLLAEKDFNIDRRRIEISSPIKEIGEYEVVVRVGQDIASLVKVSVKPLGGELEDKSVDGDDELEAPPPPIVPMIDDEAEPPAGDDAEGSDRDQGATDTAAASGDSEKAGE